MCEILKYLDHDEMIESRIFMSKDVDLSNMLFSAPFYAYLIDEQKVFKIHDFLFLVT